MRFIEVRQPFETAFWQPEGSSSKDVAAGVLQILAG
jgi:hypothetical protein